MGRAASPSAHARPAAATPPARPVSHPSDAKGGVSPLKHGPAVSVIQAAKRRKKLGEDDGDNSEDETYFERKKNTNKIQRPKFKRDCYERLSVRMNVTRTGSTVAPIKGRTPYFQFDYSGQTVYLDKTYREMRPNKKTKEWKKIDKDHLVNHIALVAAAKELELQGNYEPYQIDYGFALAYRSTKNLSFIPKDSHKSKTTYRLHNVPNKQKKEAKEMIEWKISRKDETDNVDNPRLWQELQNQHQRGKPPSWSYTHYTTS
jgi:hypothetical protein